MVYDRLSTTVERDVKSIMIMFDNFSFVLNDCKTFNERLFLMLKHLYTVKLEIVFD